MPGLSAVRSAVDHGDWRHALDLLAESGSAADSAEGLELRARAEYGNGGFEASVTAWEHLHSLHIKNGDVAAAAMAAATVALVLLIDTGLMSPVRGWLRRAERTLANADEAPALALIAVVRGYERLLSGDVDAARAASAAAIDLGRRLDVPVAVMIGRVCAARVAIFDGRFDAGLEMLDDLAIDLMSDDVDPLTAGMMYCELICAAQGMGLHDRASEWTEVMARWSSGTSIGTTGGRCRVHRAELLRISGPCDVAEAEALLACEELRPWMRREFGWPLVELGNIRLRKGDLVGAEAAFLAAHEHAWSPHPGLALLRLAQGDVQSAATMIADAIAHPFDTPWKERPPFGDLRLAPLLDAQAEIGYAAGDVATVRQAAGALAVIASGFPSRSLDAVAVLASARAALLDGDAEQALHQATAATAAWADIGAPFEAAAARMVLGDARERFGDHDGARMEWRAAQTAFETFGAVRWAAHAAGLLGDSSQDPGPPSSAGADAAATFRCEGDTRTIAFGGATVLMRDLKGFRYLERLILEPGREFHVLDLVAVERGSLPTGSKAFDGDGLRTERVEAGLPVLDEQSRDAYRRRLADIDEDIEEATQRNDIGRVELAERDREYLLAELARAVGLGGRARSVGGTSERARTSVTRSLRYALGRLAQHHPAVAAHLQQSVHTGTYCVYTPDPLSPVAWRC